MPSAKQPITRKFTNRLLEAIEQGALDKDLVIKACLQYMSEAEVQDMCESNDFLTEECEHENQSINDRYIFVCDDCGEELGR